MSITNTLASGFAQCYNAKTLVQSKKVLYVKLHRLREQSGLDQEDLAVEVGLTDGKSVTLTLSAERCPDAAKVLQLARLAAEVDAQAAQISTLRGKYCAMEKVNSLLYDSIVIVHELLTKEAESRIEQLYCNFDQSMSAILGR